MTIIRVISPITHPGTDHFYVVQDLSRDPEHRIDTKVQDRGKTVESKQSSVEIALMYNNFENTDQNTESRQDICVETEVTEPSSDLPLQECVPAIITGDSERPADFPKITDDSGECQEITHSENLQDHIERSFKSTNRLERKQNCDDRHERVIEEEKCGNWWKDGGQTILHFFTKILGKPAGMVVKAPMDRLLPNGKSTKRVLKNNKTHNGQRRGGVDGGIRLKRVNNGYIANHVYRNESRRERLTEDKSREEEHRPSILVRQIQRTRDRNLRVMLLERELRTRLPKRDANRTVNIRQISSPLC